MSPLFSTSRGSVVTVSNLEVSQNNLVTDNYFESTEMRKLFSPAEGEKVQASIIRRISILTNIIENENGIKKYVEHTKEYPLSTQQVQSLTVICTALRASYYSALNHLAVDQNWSTVIQKALQRLCELGIKATMNEKTIRRWHQWFRKHNKFPHPNHYVQMGKKVLPKVFETYPKIEKLIHKFASKNMQMLSSESLALHVKDEILPQLYELHQKECSSSNIEYMNYMQFKEFLNLTHVSASTTWRWLKMLGYKHVPNKKCYYTDRHEDPQNVEDRKYFIERYLEYEILAYVWVHLTEEQSILLENDQNVNLARVFHSYTGNDGSKMREYHVDIHPRLQAFVRNKRMGGDLSVRKPEGTRPVIIIGQDESVVKQHSFSAKCWQGVGGERKLLPKSDGYSLMISAFCSRVFGLGLHVTNEQLNEINKRRSEGTTAHYVSVDSAKEIYGTTKKKPFATQELLLQYFEVGVMGQGYWNFHHMALQTEDAFDVLSIVYPHCDFIKLTDQSSGHGKAVKDGLEVSNMNVYYGGKNFMRKTSVTNVGNFFYDDAEDPQLNLGDEQDLVFKADDKGPFYVAKNIRDNCKHDRASGKRKRKKKRHDRYSS